MTAVIPLWVLFVVLGVCAVMTVVLALVWGNFKEKRALNKWPLIRTVIDLQFVPNGGDTEVYFIETHANGRWNFPSQIGGKIDVIVNNGPLGWFGGKQKRLEPTEMISVGNMLFYGRAEFEAIFKLKNTVMENELEHFKAEAAKWQDIAEQRRHDPKTTVEGSLEIVDRLAKASMLMAPKGPSKPGGKR